MARGLALTLRDWRAGWFLAIATTPAMAAGVWLFSFNSYVDPLWILPPIGDRPFSYCVKDERQNKINRAIRGWRVDGVLLGTSRAAFVDGSLFHDHVIFNMAVSGAQPVEMAELAAVFVRHNRTPKIIYAAYDFATYKNQGEREIDPEAAVNIRQHAMDAGRWFYPIDRLVDWEVRNYAYEVRDICSAGDFPLPTYSFHGARRIKPVVHDAARRELISKHAETFAQDIFANGVFTPDKHFAFRLDSLKNAASGANIVPLVLPTTAELFLSGMAEGRLGDYFVWLGFIIQKFGSVRHFNGLNSFTRVMENFYDAHHMMPPAAKAVVDVLEGRETPAPDGFGELLTSETFPRFRDDFGKQVCRALSEQKHGDVIGNACHERL